MHPRLANEIAEVSENFAYACYLHGYGCAQSLISYKVLLVHSSGYSDLIPVIEESQSRTNARVENAVKATTGH